MNDGADAWPTEVSQEHGKCRPICIALKFQHGSSGMVGVTDSSGGPASVFPVQG